jgi:hypothetical protein
MRWQLSRPHFALDVALARAIDRSRGAVVISVRITNRLLPDMTTSARLPAALEQWLRDYCVANGKTKTEVIAKALERMRLESRTTGKHSAALAFERIERHLKPEPPVLPRRGRSSDAVRRALRAKHPR